MERLIERRKMSAICSHLKKTHNADLETTAFPKGGGGGEKVN